MREARAGAGAPFEQPAPTPHPEESPSDYLNRLKQTVYTKKVQHAILDGYAALEELSVVGSLMAPQIVELGSEESDSHVVYPMKVTLPLGSELLNSTLGAVHVAANEISRAGREETDTMFQRARQSKVIKIMERIVGKDSIDIAQKNARRKHEEKRGRSVEEILVEDLEKLTRTLQDSFDPIQVRRVAREISLLLFEKYGIDPRLVSQYSLLLHTKYISEMEQAATDDIISEESQ